MIKSVCKFPGCGSTTNNVNGYCPEHIDQVKNRGQRQKYSKSSTLYNTATWRTLRQQILKRDRYQCQICGSNYKLAVDHIQPHRDNLDLFLDPNNLITLCKVCHDNKTRQEINARKRTHTPK